MKKIIFTMLFSLCLGVAVAESPRRGALIKMDTTTHNFGHVSRRAGELTHTFILRNIGDEALVITEVNTTCTCLKVKFSKTPIPPRAETNIVVKYEPQRKDTGVFHRVIKLISNSIDGAQLITIHGISEDE